MDMGHPPWWIWDKARVPGASRHVGNLGTCADPQPTRTASTTDDVLTHCAQQWRRPHDYLSMWTLPLGVSEFLSRTNARAVDFTLGLRQAVDTGWVELTGQGKQLRLTQSGFDAMSQEEPAHRAATRR